MKKSTIGLIIFAFGLICIIGGAQDPQMKGQSGFFVFSAILCTAGLIFFLITRRRSPKSAVTAAGAEGGITTEVKSTPGEPIFYVWAENTTSYSIPSRCCACSGPAERTVSISSRQIGNRILSLEFPICRSCYKERYRWSKVIDPVQMWPINSPVRKMQFKFSNHDYAEMFAKMNKGELLK
ncbi:MAG: hypothetical protein E4G89_02730 [Methanothrix sp.]|nr:MAG: hypothetical protein E4G89_02730 [Methanothrix sp.]